MDVSFRRTQGQQLLLHQKYPDVSLLLIIEKTADPSNLSFLD